jgi:hypothetical protein
VSRRAALPGANELFRTTSTALDEAGNPATSASPAADETAGLSDVVAHPAAPSGGPRPVGRTSPRLRRVRGGPTPPSGRERHEEKITVYLSAEELMALEDARVTLYREHGIKVDRGRIVREAIALVIADLEAKASHAVLVRQLEETG